MGLKALSPSDDTEPGGEVDTSEKRVVLWRDLDRLEKWDSKSSVKFNQVQGPAAGTP